MELLKANVYDELERVLDLSVIAKEEGRNFKIIILGSDDARSCIYILNLS